MIQQNFPKIAIVAGETSGDVLGSGLISALKLHFPCAEFFGIGGARMAESGCKILFDMDRIELMGLDGFIGKIGDILKIRSSLYQRIVEEKPDLFIGIDVPDFNISLEKKVRGRGIQTVHYVSPTVWAWRGYRIHKIRKAVSLMLTLFPFEKRYYQEKNIPVTCVGHPIADEIEQPDRSRARRDLGSDFGDDDLLVAVLPGSRGSEVKRLGAVFVEAMRLTLKRYPNLKFVIPFANSKVEKIFRESVGSVEDLPIRFLDGSSRLAMEASNLVLLASGTAALEAALLERPHIVAYKLTGFTYFLFRFLRHVDYYSMSNHLLAEPKVPELMQGNATAENISGEMIRYLSSPQAGRELEAEFREIRKQLKLNANVQAAEAVRKLIDSGRSDSTQGTGQ